jgi:CBS domain-containing protein
MGTGRRFAMLANRALPDVIESCRAHEPVPGREVDAPSSTEWAPLRLPIGMPVSMARAALVDEGEVIALVSDRGVDVGVVTAQDLVPHGSTPTASIGDVMGREIVNIDPTTDLRRTLRAYREAGWYSAIRRRPRELPAGPVACGSPP